MIPILGIPILSRPDLLWNMLASIDVPVGRIVVVDNGDVVPVEEERARGITVIRPRSNLGVGASWNLIIKTNPTAKWWAIANFDITFALGDLARLAGHMEKTNGLGLLGGGFAAFGIRREAIEKVGWFDENFVPAYYEDNDYDYRCRLADVPMEGLPTGMHHLISSTLNGSEKYRNQNARTFPENYRYYLKKWGGTPYHEVYTSPFNEGGDLRSWQLDIRRLADQSWTREEI
jgi:GT2 family glycosyltransferase